MKIIYSGPVVCINLASRTTDQHLKAFVWPKRDYSIVLGWTRNGANLGEIVVRLRLVCQEDLPKEQINILKKAFEAFDHEKKGCIGTVMVGTILTMLGHQITDDYLQEIIKEVDVDGSGELEFEEFVTLASRFMVEEDAEAMQQELKEAFRLYDKEGNGYITTQVLREILRELDDKISAEELDMMIEEIDSDGSGTVDFDEFMEVMTGGDD
ncbi:troponin C type IIIa protein [Danaus plexippus plexippus]|uniref:Troponin C type IIIa protein n=1 Tax=Danaus plexippus plexippus TaxID=278856 RepID=A0A212ERZ9_DANPL|nr:troponin C type IIIa protein [Danaus plexippus plexippus]